MKRVAVLGSTGSIGTSCLDVIERLPDRLSVVALTAHTNWDMLCAQASRFHPRWVSLTDTASLAIVDRSRLGGVTELLDGPDRVERIVRSPETDIVLTAIVGSAGLEGTWAAIEAGKTVCVANKETLVLGGAQVVNLARRTGAKILPVDSEHSALFQAMQCGRANQVRRVLLTASGGPFRTWSTAQMKLATPEQALKHPTWQMGPKISIDSATMMNKALEIIEAKWLFDLRPDQIEVVIHPESIVHSMVEFVDGSIIAQLSTPDMRLPIQYALCYPDRMDCPVPRLPFTRPFSLQFEPADLDRFPSLRLGLEVAEQGGTAGAVLNAANEVAVARFLNRQVAFPDMARICRDILDRHTFDPNPDLTGLLDADRWARNAATQWEPT